MAAHVSRVSDKLHLRGGRRTLSFGLGITAESFATAIGVLLLIIGLVQISNALVAASALILAATFQPLIKTSVGQVLGIRYSYAYLWCLEPRFKMRYGTYLTASRWRRVLFHLSGTVGSPLALWLVSSLAAQSLKVAASICNTLFWITVVMQVIPFVAGLSGPRRLGAIRLVRLTSGGGAGVELREALLRRPEMPIRKRKAPLKKQSELEKKQAEISKLRGQIRRQTNELKRQITEKEALLLEKDKELASMRELMEEKVKGLESSLVQKEELIGRITHYYSHLSVGIIELTGGELKVADVIHIKGKHTDVTQTVNSMQIEHQNVSQAEKGKVVGVKVKEKVREHDQVFRV